MTRRSVTMQARDDASDFEPRKTRAKRGLSRLRKPSIDEPAWSPS